MRQGINEQYTAILNFTRSDEVSDPLISVLACAKFPDPIPVNTTERMTAKQDNLIVGLIHGRDKLYIMSLSN
ncbi:hypothetical protein CY34DRAFT_614845 [Suillus luteus UH-Slu-Lm8-n1]|uniref:Uncharacterized protein n=1 Tax=Suillus luteus UH-Slu-Lm8-n1 TaxID=930992 RepID=A0A0D0AS97_9AGAM|nr:hypothetical protein CY34DRAFT_614845 [Suillus luteus UH-Slu-Lm8-n1]